jgi:hypothetical protein
VLTEISVREEPASVMLLLLSHQKLVVRLCAKIVVLRPVLLYPGYATILATLDIHPSRVFLGQFGPSVVGSELTTPRAFRLGNAVRVVPTI